jgi:hypothetical protein
MIERTDVQRTDTHMRNFHRKRPQQGHAFYCPGDVLAFINIYVTGSPGPDSETNQRALRILTEGGLIRESEHGNWCPTESGNTLLAKIVNLHLPTPGEVS